MPFGNSLAESQRDSGSKPRVARNELPWETGSQANNPNGVAARLRKRDTTPLGLKPAGAATQGSSCLATLGLEDTIPSGLQNRRFLGCSGRFCFPPNSRKVFQLAQRAEMRPDAGQSPRIGTPAAHAEKFLLDRPFLKPIGTCNPNSVEKIYRAWAKKTNHKPRKNKSV